MVGQTKLMRTKWYPRPHDLRHSWNHGLETAVQNVGTMYPIVMYDEGLGTPSAYEANPENAAFVEDGAPNNFVGSRLDLILAKFRFSMTKAALETDNLHVITGMFMPVFLSFKEDYTAIDELSSAEIQDILELQTETTDRQGFPLYNNVKMVEKYANSALLAATVPGLTTTQVMEGITFSPNAYYDMLHYMTNSGKLKSVQGGMNWFTLTRDRPTKTIKIKLRRKSKAMNPYNFFGVIIYFPAVGSNEQVHVAADTTNVSHVTVDTWCRYNEWNPDFNFKKV